MRSPQPVPQPGLPEHVTILLGLPLGRTVRPMPAMKAFLNAVAVGILLFLVWDVLSAGWQPVDAALSALHDKTGGFAPVFGYGGLFLAGLSVGLLGLVGYDSYLRRAAQRPIGGPGAMSVTENPGPVRGIAGWPC